MAPTEEEDSDTPLLFISSRRCSLRKALRVIARLTSFIQEEVEMTNVNQILLLQTEMESGYDINWG